ncbi:(Na+)-NQR maturation NqrM [Vannielia litorea]|uniref:(Na+)-NQR maturation NqrM n=1 Tax=Vannielia litorea TaxID=1217970 RepID=UPI001BCB36BA
MLRPFVRLGNRLTPQQSCRFLQTPPPRIRPGCGGVSAFGLAKRCECQDPSKDAAQLIGAYR